MTEMHDELLERVVDELRTLPPVDEAAVARILAAAVADSREVRGASEVRGSSEVRGAPHRSSGGRRAVRGRSWWRPRVPLAAAAAFALAAGVAGYAIRGGRSASQPTTVASTPSQSAASLVSGYRPARGAPARTTEIAVPTQFVLAAHHAGRVALVGDFNGWNAASTPLARDRSSGIWTVTVPLAPGRHVYAFMVDGTRWTLDPRAATAQDPDFGTPSSVVLVGTP